MIPEFRNFKLVPHMMYAPGAITQVRKAVEEKAPGPCVFLIDSYFKNSDITNRMGVKSEDLVLFLDTIDEPKTQLIDQLCEDIRAKVKPSAIIGVGGGILMDLAKAVAVLYTNPGKAENYQGWNLVKNPALYKVGVPTISGTGSEVSRTTVLTGPTKKQGINSDFSLFDQIVLDPEIIKSVPNPQRFYTGMDCYIHCVESLCGTFINDFARAFATKALDLCEDVFLGKGTDGDLMMASLMGGFSIVYSEVGVCHSLSYGLSYGLGFHHGEANCIAFQYLDEYYPKHVPQFRAMLDKHRIVLKKNVMKDVSPELLEKMVDVALTMERALHNALGPEWKTLYSREKIKSLYRMM
ncbi:MAG: iron-containing alcohol dehydrogenase family protein [Bdellovibrionales bacterium]